MRLSLLASTFTRASLPATRTTRLLSTSTARMSENYTAKPTGHGGMSGATQTPANSGIGHDKPKALDEDGAIGKQFKRESSCVLQREGDMPLTSRKADGAIGQVGEKVGGPFSKDGAIGKQFTTDGAIGGTVQENAGGTTKKSN